MLASCPHTLGGPEKSAGPDTFAPVESSWGFRRLARIQVRAGQCGLRLHFVGTTVGTILALMVYAISAISVPLLMTRKVDAITAMSASLEAVLENPKPMTLWTALIAGLILLGIETRFVVAFPLIGLRPGTPSVALLSIRVPKTTTTLTFPALSCLGRSSDLP